MLGTDIQSAQFSGAVDAYVRTLQQTNWGELAWVEDTSWSDDDFVFVRLRTTAGRFPAYLTNTVNSMTIAPGDRGRVVFAVRFDWLGGHRLHGAGG
jgi:hypothetical protein